ncbi:hypothetical protein NTE_00246 [Candidatus Nitrososphaera evergladensis SR1]|uniref:Uncharacterized protein n=1 Tax=Candidatus Nitrososphaera evergladensis SR1 TaxID=1459636 RepID=A0A075MM47_9ARCH|nr:hypothetical protein NTE_00246 [Candidatus Nitrososphaera evergladensis SR1]
MEKYLKSFVPRYTPMSNLKAIIAVVAIVAAMGLVAAAVVPSVVLPQQAFADPPHGNSFKHCHSFGPGHSDDACR